MEYELQRLNVQLGIWMAASGHLWFANGNMNGKYGNISGNWWRDRGYGWGQTMVESRKIMVQSQHLWRRFVPDQAGLDKRTCRSFSSSPYFVNDLDTKQYYRCIEESKLLDEIGSSAKPPNLQTFAHGKNLALHGSLGFFSLLLTMIVENCPFKDDLQWFTHKKWDFQSPYEITRGYWDFFTPSILRVHWSQLNSPIPRDDESTLGLEHAHRAEEKHEKDKESFPDCESCLCLLALG